MTHHKQLFFLFCITFSWHAYPMPINKPINNDDIKQRFVQPIQKHPKKTVAGVSLLAYGLQLLSKGIEICNIKPDHNNNYNQQGTDTEIVGGLLITIGTLLLSPVIKDIIFPENTNTEKIDPTHNRVSL